MNQKTYWIAAFGNKLEWKKVANVCHLSLYCPGTHKIARFSSLEYQYLFFPPLHPPPPSPPKKQPSSNPSGSPHIVNNIPTDLAVPHYPPSLCPLATITPATFPFSLFLPPNGKVLESKTNRTRVMD